MISVPHAWGVVLQAEFRIQTRRAGVLPLRKAWAGASSHVKLAMSIA
jgi:hypothetical protein